RPAPPGARAQRRGVRQLAGRDGCPFDEEGGTGTGGLRMSVPGFRQEVREWLRTHLPAQPLPSVDTAEGFERHRAWERELAAARLSVVTWPAAYGGRDASLAEWLAFEEEYYAAGAPVRAGQNGLFLL